jgi:hypothetical protein
MSRDRQRSLVYAWEDRVVAPRDGTMIPYASAQPMVDAIWADLRLLYPPRVEKLPRQARTTVASANRLCLYLPEKLPSWCLLHELAHSLSSTEDGRSDGHGPVFMGLYVSLLVRYLRMDEGFLAASLAAAGIKICLGAAPVFCDRKQGLLF